MRFIINIPLLMLILTSRVCSQTWWSELNSGVTTTLTSVSVPDPNIRWACGYNGTVIKSNAFPINFTIANYGIPSNINLFTIWGININKALCAGNSGSNTYVYRTSNSGNNWVQVFTQANGSINAIWLRDTVRGIMIGNPVGGRWSIWRTSNGGINWDSTGMYLPQAGSETGWNNSIYFVDSNYMSTVRHLWFGTNNSRVYHSTDFGFTWTAQSIVPESSSMSLLFSYWSQPSAGYSGGSNLMQTSNYGSSWSIVPNTLGSGNITGLAGNMGGVDGPFPFSWYVRNDNKIYYSEGFGTYWTVQYTAPSGIFRYMSQARPGEYGEIFAVRDNGGISYCSCTPSGIRKTSGEVAEDYLLEQNYPNPFNPVTKIKFSLPGRSEGGPHASLSSGAWPGVRLIIYDITGCEVATLVNESLKPGTYEVEWDGSNYSSGVYFYKLITDEFTETKRMVLVK
jgi:photosystem II stability/assembly factor-like uncharacterized protein